MPLCGLPRAQWPNSCNLNLYGDGAQAVGWHADDEPLFQGRVSDCLVVSLSLGQPRVFQVAAMPGRAAPVSFPLGAGDLL